MYIQENTIYKLIKVGGREVLLGRVVTVYVYGLKPSVYITVKSVSLPMRPKARGLVQHGDPPFWLEESGPAGVILYVMDGPYRLPFPVALTGAAQLRAHGISSCCYVLCKCTQPSVMCYCHVRKAWPGSLVDPCILSGLYCL
jgi:hypothetical protein